MSTTETQSIPVPEPGLTQDEIVQRAQDETLGRGDVEAIRAWLGEHIHRHGRRLDTEALVERVTGGPIDAEPFLRYAMAV